MHGPPDAHINLAAQIAKRDDHVRVYNLRLARTEQSQV